ASFIAQTVIDLNLAGVVIDNEEPAGSNYFQGGAAEAKAYATTLRAKLPSGCKLVMSSHDIVSGHPKAQIATFAPFMDVNAPQVYYGQSRDVASRLQWAINENASIAAPFFPTGAAFLKEPGADDGGCLSVAECAKRARQFILEMSARHHSDPARYPGYSF